MKLQIQKNDICNDVGVTGVHGSKIGVNKKISWTGLTCLIESDPIQQIIIESGEVWSTVKCFK